MSFRLSLDKEAVRDAGHPQPMSASSTAHDEQVIDAISRVEDPELGIGIVELGLVYRAERSSHGVEVDMTLTSRNCPLGEFIVDQVRGAISDRFGPVPTSVRLVWEPRWRPEMAEGAALKLSNPRRS